MVKADTTRSRVIRSAMAQPTTLWEYRSSTAARYSPPSSVQMEVISETQTRLGTWVVKSCPNRFGATGRWCLDWVVALYFLAALARSKVG